jgi:hypothetical protein
MIEYYLNLGYKTISDKLFIPQCKSVIKSMTNNLNYPNSVGLLAELTVAFNAYFTAIPPKHLQNDVNLLESDDRKNIVKSVMRAMGFHVQCIARDNYTMLMTTGFSIAKRKGTSSKEMPMPAVEIMTTNGTPFQLIVKCKASAATRLYDVRISTDNTKWIYAGTNTSSKVKVDNLPVDVLLHVQVRTRNTDHETPWSASVPTRIFDYAVALSKAN